MAIVTEYVPGGYTVYGLKCTGAFHLLEKIDSEYFEPDQHHYHAFYSVYETDLEEYKKLSDFQKLQVDDQPCNMYGFFWREWNADIRKYEIVYSQYKDVYFDICDTLNEFYKRNNITADRLINVQIVNIPEEKENTRAQSAYVTYEKLEIMI